VGDHERLVRDPRERHVRVHLLSTDSATEERTTMFGNVIAIAVILVWLLVVSSVGCAIFFLGIAVFRLVRRDSSPGLSGNPEHGDTSFTKADARQEGSSCETKAMIS
jgi:hypothetical protein